MKRLHAVLFTAIAACLPFAAVHAQDADAPQPITLSVQKGQVMVSQGTDFATAPSGTTVVPGDRVMLAEESAATLHYRNGCVKALEVPGVYTVNDDCDPGSSAVASNGSTGTVIAGVLGGLALIGAAAGGGGSDSTPPPPPPPVSP